MSDLCTQSVAAGPFTLSGCQPVQEGITGALASATGAASTAASAARTAVPDVVANGGEAATLLPAALDEIEGIASGAANLASVADNMFGEPQYADSLLGRAVAATADTLGSNALSRALPTTPLGGVATIASVVDNHVDDDSMFKPLTTALSQVDPVGQLAGGIGVAVDLATVAVGAAFGQDNTVAELEQINGDLLAGEYQPMAQTASMVGGLVSDRAALTDALVSDEAANGRFGWLVALGNNLVDGGLDEPFILAIEE